MRARHVRHLRLRAPARHHRQGHEEPGHQVPHQGHGHQELDRSFR